MRVSELPSTAAPRRPMPREVGAGPSRLHRLVSAPVPERERAPLPAESQWLVDLTALSRCRALFARHGVADNALRDDHRDSQLAMMDVPPAYDQFCRTHFASVKRLHPELNWEDACPAYAIALSAHAVLCVALDDEREKQFELHWLRIRGASTLTWMQARPLIADGCCALGRMDPLAMHR